VLVPETWADGAVQSAPIGFSVAYTADLLRNTTGGANVGSAYLDNLDVTATLDAASLLGWNGVTLHAHALYNNRAQFSERFTGDAQTASNIDAPRAFRVFELWGEWRSSSSAATSLRAGIYDLNSEFDASETRGVFMHSSFGVGHELAQTGGNGPSIFPVTGLGLRIDRAFSNGWAARAVALDALPGDPDDPSRTRLRVSSEDGALLAAELERRGERVQKFALGTWSYTKSVERLEDTALGALEPRRLRNRGIYAMADLRLWRDAAAEQREISFFMRHGRAAENANEYRASTQLGFVWQQPVLRDRAESLALGVCVAESSRALRAARLGEGLDTDGREIAIELTYRVEATSWLTLQPDLQYIMNPGVDPELDDAFVVGVRFEIAFGN
jgi:porin